MSLDAEKLGELARRIVAEALAGIGDIKRSRGIFAIFNSVQSVVRRVEEIGAELRMIGEDKRRVAVEAILLLVPDRWVPDAVLRPFVGWAVDRAVAAMNK